MSMPQPMHRRRVAGPGGGNPFVMKTASSSCSREALAELLKQRRDVAGNDLGPLAA